MFNVAVFKLKDMIKYFTYISITILITISCAKYFSTNKEEKKEIKTNIIETKMQKILSNSNTKTIDNQIISLKKSSKDKNQEQKLEQEKETNVGYLKQFMKTELSSLEGIENNKEKIEENNKEQKEPKDEEKTKNEEKKEEVKLASTNVKTEVITNNPIKEVYNTEYGKVKIRNGTNINLTEEIMKPDIKIDNKNVLIFHTHTCESYTPSEKYQYQQTGNFRTTDLNFSVARLGEELEKHLKEYKIPTIHNINYHDYPSYNGSYTRSLQTVQNILSQNKSDIIIDIHRDAIGSRSDYAPIVKIGDDVAAQIMYVIGTNEGGLEHPNWQQNLKFAIKVQEKAEEMYPGLFKPIMLTKYRYNQHTRKTCKHNGSRCNRKYFGTIYNKYEIFSKSSI